MKTQISYYMNLIKAHILKEDCRILLSITLKQLTSHVDSIFSWKLSKDIGHEIWFPILIRTSVPTLMRMTYQ